MTGIARNGATVGLFAAVAAVFTWPLLADPGRIVVARQFDVHGMLWLTSVAREVGPDLRVALAAWPEGQSVAQADSLLVALAAWLLPAVRPLTWASLLAFGGPVVSAWAAERFAARALGAAWPWSLLAGLAFGFSGLAATALLEGHLYMLADPWLPLLGWVAVVGFGGEGRAWHGLAIAVCWTLCLLTSAYVGICATVLLVVVAVNAAFERSVQWRPVLVGAIGILPVGIAYAYLLTLSRARELPTDLAWSSRLVVESGSATLSDLVGWTRGVDLQSHSLCPTLGFTAPALALFGLRVLDRKGGSRIWMILAGIAVVLALGPSLRLQRAESGLPWVLYPLVESRFGAWFRFPARVLPLAYLGLGAVGAVVATRIAARRLRWALPLLTFGLVDALLVTGAPFRTLRVPMEVPSAYVDLPGEGAILELVPEFQGWASDLGHDVLDHTCTYQRVHGRPLLNACLNPLLPQGPLVSVGRWLRFALLSPDTEDAAIVSSRLAALGVGAVAFHPDLFPRGLREEIGDALVRALGEPVAQSRDAGDNVRIYRVQGDVGDPSAILAALRKEGW